ncbi:TetR family transcriptional regulator [Streptomyces olivaceus]|uniref:TetR/AcrR family transcriptional regulator n=1 Tax=Streptomyces olivaceus TaxID=47716 RepID=UPI001CCB808D|nr:TetR family transcriptional regulator [Streptomyces olivaceus]MBZ6083646.1 TetR family transcriptional regulator [Streptomyces olivaceus]
MRTTTNAAGTRPEQERAVRRRNAILDAATRLLLSGTSAITHRAVAADADVPLGAIRYYYDTRESLLLACIEHFDTTRSEAARGAIMAARDTPLERAEAARLALITYNGPALDDDALRGMIGWVADCARESPAISERLVTLREILDRDLRALLDAAGYAHVPTRLASAVIDGAIFAATAERRSGIAEMAICDLSNLLAVAQPPGEKSSG